MPPENQSTQDTPQEDKLTMLDYLKKEHTSPLARIIALFVIVVLSGALIAWAVYTYKTIQPKTPTTADNQNQTTGTEKQASDEEKVLVMEDIPVNEVESVNENLKIVSDDDLDNLYPGNPMKLRLLLTLDDGTTKDVTEEAEWASTDRGVLYVSNNAGSKGEINSQMPGEVTVTAQYQNYGATLKLQSTRPELKVSCVVNKINVKVGEQVNWIIQFDKLGAPNYTYKIEGDDGLNADLPVYAYSYDTPGVKKSKVSAVDMIGTEAEADCPDITVVE